MEEEKQELKNAVLSGIKKDILEESADLLEVIRAINGNDISAVLEAMESKKQKRGGFEERKFLERVDDCDLSK